MAEKSTDTEIQRVMWHSRRGMLELDLALGPFAKHEYAQLSAEDQAKYRKLLEEEDTDLFQWVLQASKPNDPELVDIMDKILAYARANKPTS
ncbi:MAG: succinate dehydrogenase assembly factor 2 [Sinobacterium sp.]|nr:succinate dehydrogenase assembly factor 2 [Sinobacterium sp.]